MIPFQYFAHDTLFNELCSKLSDSKYTPDTHGLIWNSPGLAGVEWFYGVYSVNTFTSGVYM